MIYLSVYCLSVSALAKLCCIHASVPFLICLFLSFCFQGQGPAERRLTEATASLARSVWCRCHTDKGRRGGANTTATAAHTTTATAASATACHLEREGEEGLSCHARPALMVSVCLSVAILIHHDLTKGSDKIANSHVV